MLKRTMSSTRDHGVVRVPTRISSRRATRDVKVLAAWRRRAALRTPGMSARRLCTGRSPPCHGGTGRLPPCSCAWSVLHPEIEAQKFAYPIVLRDGRQPLVQEVLQTVVIRLYGERSSPQVRSSMSYCLDEADELPLICGESSVSRCYGTAEISHWPCSLMKNSPTTGT